MWKMFDDMIECDECGGPLGPPPKFMIPPPPRPPSMGDGYSLGNSNCNEEEMAKIALQSWDKNFCDSMPMQDSSLYITQSLQISAIVAVFSLLLVLIVLISSLFIWKSKRKVQICIPCKTPARGTHFNGTIPMSIVHSVAFEDPDAHLGHHRPLVMLNHHNINMIHDGKTIHYPSGYPMTSSPPFLVSSSPGPDPYRSHDNVYEELTPSRCSEGESEQPIHSDDDFSEEELSLPGERSCIKYNMSDCTSTRPTLSTNYHNWIPHSSNLPAGFDRKSILSTSSSIQEASTATVLSSSSSHNNNTSASLVKSANKFHNSATGHRPRWPCTTDSLDISSLAYRPEQRCQTLSEYRSRQHHSMNRINNNEDSIKLHSTTTTVQPQFNNTLQSEVDKRNLINGKLSHDSVDATVPNIYRVHLNKTGEVLYPPQCTSTKKEGNMIASGSTGPNASSGYKINRAALSLNSTYSYAEPLYQGDLTCQNYMFPPMYHRLDHPNYIMLNSTNTHHRQSPMPALSLIYSHCDDSSFGSDSGYSHHTPASSIGRLDYDVNLPILVPALSTQKSSSKLSTSLTFGCRNSISSNSQTALLTIPTTALLCAYSAKTSESSSDGNDTSPNTNSDSSTNTSTIEVTSSDSNSSVSNHNNKESNNTAILITTSVQS